VVGRGRAQTHQCDRRVQHPYVQVWHLQANDPSLPKLVFVLEVHAVLTECGILWMHLKLHKVVLDEHLQPLWKLCKLTIGLTLLKGKSIVSVLEDEPSHLVVFVVPDTPVDDLLVLIQDLGRLFSFFHCFLFDFAPRNFLPVLGLASHPDRPITYHHPRTCAEPGPQSGEVVLPHDELDDVWVSDFIELVSGFPRLWRLGLFKYWCGQTIWRLTRSLGVVLFFSLDD